MTLRRFDVCKNTKSEEKACEMYMGRIPMLNGLFAYWIER